MFIELKEITYKKSEGNSENNISWNRESQSRDRSYKEKHIEILELNCTITEMKNSLEALTRKCNLTYEFNWGYLVRVTKRKKNEEKWNKKSLRQL